MNDQAAVWLEYANADLAAARRLVELEAPGATLDHVEELLEWIQKRSNE